MAVATVVAAAFAPMVFYGDTAVAVAGIVCWGVGMGSQDSIIRAAVATMIVFSA